jgi:hypothetical protein
LKLKANTALPKTEKAKIAELKHGPTCPGGQDIWSQERLQIPPCPPTMLEFCKIIELTYYLHVSMNIFLRASTTYLHAQAKIVIILIIPTGNTNQRFEQTWILGFFKGMIRYLGSVYIFC